MNEKFSVIAGKLIRRLSSDSEGERMSCLSALDKMFVKYGYSWEDMARAVEGNTDQEAGAWTDRINQMLDFGDWSKKQIDFLVNMKYWKNKTEKQIIFLEDLWETFQDNQEQGGE